MYESTKFEDSSQVAKIIEAKCRTFLEEKYLELNKQ